ncbi:PerC family transcriptional regulator [Pantoea allii]
MKLEDSIAESLEQSGLWHRAARRWLSVMDATVDDAIRKR